MPPTASASQLFEIGNSPIDPGVMLIEASAGTGKTYAIAGLTVRLIAEHGYSIADILVVTFTEAATRELRERIRSRIRDALEFLQSGTPEKDEALTAFQSGGEGDVKKAIRSLKNAFLSFDEAAIFTIHGFCQRMLRENAFETGVLFEVELVTDSAPVWRQAIEDFWRTTFYEVDEEIGAVVAWLQKQQELSIENLQNILMQLSKHPDLVILPEKRALGDFDTSQEELKRTFGSIRQLYERDHLEIKRLLFEFPSFNKPYNDEALDAIFSGLDGLLKSNAPNPAVFAHLLRLAPEALSAGTRKGKTPPDHPLFDLCERLKDHLDEFVWIVRNQFRTYVQTDLPAQKRSKNIVTFDDLLNGLLDGLKGEGGQKLKETIGAKFKAALIDEFQDTDPVQWEIFNRVFGNGEHRLFLIGDPKQAIYGFRGADIFTYMSARERVPADRRFTLGTNWRSDPLLIEGVNRLFSQHSAPFVFSGITFEPVASARASKPAEIDLGMSGFPPEPLQLVPVFGDEAPQLNADDARKKIYSLMAGEIVRLLSSDITLNEKKVEPADFAILTRTRSEAREMRETLIAAKIPAVIRTDQSVFETREAGEVERLLAAILEPNRDAFLRSALATRIFSWNADEIFEHISDENRWQEIVENFYKWQQIWVQHGFIRMFRPLFQKEKSRLLGIADGERLVANFQQIAESLHRAEYEMRLTPHTLLRWLSEQRNEPDQESEHHLIRLEKDEKAVQIVTIHASKGLEYPIVFCPFNWTSISHRKGDVLFHDQANNNRLTWDLQNPADRENCEQNWMEDRAEAMRLLYVAVTRARNRCYLFWPATRDSRKPDQNVLAYLFGKALEDKAATVEDAFKSLPSHPSHATNQLQPLSNGIDFQSDDDPEQSLEARQLSREIPQSLLITSFSGLTAAASEILPDRDRLPETHSVESDEEEENRLSIFSFPKGVKAGNFFHTLLENFDFADSAVLPTLVDEQMKRFHFDAEFAPIVTEKLQELLQLPLVDGKKLAEIPEQDRLVETAFYYPILPIRSRELASVFKKEDLPPEYIANLGQLKFHPVDGYMTGFIDLIVRVFDRYYIIDWKSNWLGSAIGDYCQENLRRAMSESYYFLQYHLYTLALHRHLEENLPDYRYGDHFGGIFYIFLRGISADHPENGIFFDRPSEELVEKLERKLMPGRELPETEGALL